MRRGPAAEDSSYRVALASSPASWSVVSLIEAAQPADSFGFLPRLARSADPPARSRKRFAFLRSTLAFPGGLVSACSSSSGARSSLRRIAAGMVSDPHAGPCTTASTEQRGVGHGRVVVVVVVLLVGPVGGVVDVVETNSSWIEMSAQ